MNTGCFLLSFSLLAGAQSSPENHDIERLINRFNEYNQLFKDRKFSKAYELLIFEAKDKKGMKKVWVSDVKEMASGLKILSWEILEISRIKNRVRIIAQYKYRLYEYDGKWEEMISKETDFWDFDDGDWYFWPLKDDDWDESLATKIPIPSKD